MEPWWYKGHCRHEVHPSPNIQGTASGMLSATDRRSWCPLPVLPTPAGRGRRDVWVCGRAAPACGTARGDGPRPGLGRVDGGTRGWRGPADRTPLDAGGRPATPDGAWGQAGRAPHTIATSSEKYMAAPGRGGVDIKRAAANCVGGPPKTPAPLWSAADRSAAKGGIEGQRAGDGGSGAVWSREPHSEGATPQCLGAQGGATEGSGAGVRIRWGKGGAVRGLVHWAGVRSGPQPNIFPNIFFSFALCASCFFVRSRSSFSISLSPGASSRA